MKRNWKKGMALAMVLTMTASALPWTAWATPSQRGEPTNEQSVSMTPLEPAKPIPTTGTVVTVTTGTETKEYASFAEAIQAVGTTPATMKVTQSMALKEPIIFTAGQTITFDLNGHTLVSTLDQAVFQVPANTTWKLTDSSPEGQKGCVQATNGILENHGTATIVGGTYRSGQNTALENAAGGILQLENISLTAGGVGVAQNGAQLTLDSAIIQAPVAVQAAAGTTTIAQNADDASDVVLSGNLAVTGGTVRLVTGWYQGATVTSGALTVENGVFEKAITVNGGTLTAKGGTFVQDMEAYVPAGYGQLKAATTYQVGPYTDETAAAAGAVVKGTEGKTYYKTIADGLAEGKTNLTLVADLTDPITIAQEATIQKNGHTASIQAGTNFHLEETDAAYLVKKGPAIPEGTYTIIPCLENVADDDYTEDPDRKVENVAKEEVYEKLPSYEHFTFQEVKVEDNQVFAYYKRNTYHVEFKGYNDVVAGGFSEKYETVIKTPQAPSRKNYKFRGWSDGTTTYGANADYTIQGDATLTALWKKDNSDDTGSPQYRPSKKDIHVSVTKGGSAQVDPERARKDDKVTLTVEPAKGYEVKNVVVTDEDDYIIKLDWEDDNEATFTMPNKEVYITVSFTQVEEEEEEEEPQWKNPFDDVDEDDWFYESVGYVYEAELMEGMSQHRFEPNTLFTRAMIAQVLYNREGRPWNSGNTSFTDVTRNAWYADAVSWAYNKGLMEGYGNGKFGPNDPLTREQMAAVLYRYAGYCGYSTSVSGNLNAFRDGYLCSSWAKNSVQWAVNEEIIQGMGNGYLQPQGVATRAQVATMLMQFEENVVE